MKKKIGIGQSHSKIILMGEHSVVYGYSAIALPLKSIEVFCFIEESKSVLNRDPQDPVSVAIFASLDYLGEEAYISYRIASGVPERRGMGSSAAVAIAAIRATFDYFGQALSLSLLEKLANQAEEVAHCNPSGLDVKTCLSDVAIHFVKGEGFKPLLFDLDAYLIIADTGLHGHTKEAVEKVKALGDSAVPHLKSLGDLSQQAEEALLTNNLSDLGGLMTQAHKELKQLGVSSVEADELVAHALSVGALGSKMTGGGLGGCLIALTTTEIQAQMIAEKLEEKGAINTWIERL